MKRARVVVALAVVALVAFGAWRLSSSSARSEDVYYGTVETRAIQVGSKIAGRVTEVLAEEGQTVTAGAVLVRFDAAELMAAHAQSVARLAQAKAELERLTNGRRPQEIQQAEAEAARQRALLEVARSGPRRQEVQEAAALYEASQAEARNAEQEYSRVAALAKTGDVSAARHDEAKARRDSAVRRAAAAMERVSLLRAGTRPEEIRAAERAAAQAQAAAELARAGFRKEEIATGRAQVLEAEAVVAQLEAQLKELELRAPATAAVQAVSVRPGDLVQPGRVVFTLLESSQLWVRTWVPETALGTVRLGQKASITIDTFPGRRFDGSVASVSSEAEFLPRNVQTRSDREHRVFGVKVKLDSSDGTIKSGMAASVRLR